MITRTLEERIDLYQKILSLFEAGFRRGQIVREMRSRFNVMMDHHQVVNWTERGVSPYGRVYRFEPIPTPELAYLCGVKLGDATQSKGTWQHSYKFRLLVTDKEFPAEFSRCASVVLKCKPFKVWWYERRRMWCTEVSSIMLYKFLKGGLARFKEFVSHCSKCAAMFLRGFFDSEASVSVSGLTVSNGHLDVVLYVQYLLKHLFRIETTGPRPTGLPPGTRILIKGRPTTVNLQMNVIRVRNKWIGEYARHIGFTITRKATSLKLLRAATTRGRR